MPFNLPTKNKGQGAPDIEDGLAVLRFDDLRLVEHPDWAGTDKYGHDDDGTRYHFDFTVMSEDGSEVVYATVEGVPTGDPLELDATTRTSTGEKSNFYAILSGILTAAELKQWDDATEDAPFDGSHLQGRLVHGKVEHNKKGWPFVAQTISPFKKPK